MLTVGDLNADPEVIPCLAKCIASGRLVDLALAYSLGDGKERMLLVGSSWRRRSVQGGTFLSLALTPCLPLLLAGLLIGCSLLIFLYMRSLPSGGERLKFLVLSLYILFGLPVGLIRLIGLLPLLLRLSKMLGMFTGRSWRLCLSLFIGFGVRMKV